MAEPSEKSQRKRAHTQERIAIFSGLLVIPVITVVQLLQLPKPLPLLLFMSVICFAASIPLLGAAIHINYVSLRLEEYDLKAVWTTLPILMGVFASTAGMILVFCYLSWIAGGVFVVSGLVGVSAWGTHYRAVQVAKSEVEEEST